MFIWNQTPATRCALCWRPTRTGGAFLSKASFINAILKLSVGLSYCLEPSSAASFTLNFRASRKAKQSQKLCHFTEWYEFVQNVIVTSLVKKCLLFHEMRMFYIWLWRRCPEPPKFRLHTLQLLNMEFNITHPRL